MYIFEAFFNLFSQVKEVKYFCLYNIKLEYLDSCFCLLLFDNGQQCKWRMASILRSFI